MTPELPPAWHLPGPYPVTTQTGCWTDADRGRTLSLRSHGPGARSGHAAHAAHPAHARHCDPPLILYSPGLGGSADSGARWLQHWASHGFFCLTVQHPGSDASLFAGQPAAASRRLLRAAMTREQLQARCDDLSFVLAEIARRAAEHDPAWTALATSPRALAGHSFGAITVQAVAGEWRPDPLKTPPRSGFAAFLALSPSARGDTATAALQQRFGAIDAPFFSLTGSADHGLAGSDIRADNRRLPHAGMPPGDKYLLVLDAAGHHQLAGEPAPMEQDRAGSTSLRARRQLAATSTATLLAASTAFWLACLMPGTDSADHARQWLRHNLPHQLTPGDHFVWK